MIPNIIDINMALLLLLLLISSGFVFLRVCATPDYGYGYCQSGDLVSNQLPDYIIPTYYNVIIDGHLDSDFLYGVSQVFITINQPTQNISFHAEKPHVKLIRLPYLHVTSSVPYHSIIPENCIYNSNSHIINVHFEDMLIPDRYVLEIEFITDLCTEGSSMFRTTYLNEDKFQTWLIATYKRASRARQMFPCWDEPTFKAKFNISVNHYAQYMALSNMPVRNADAPFSAPFAYFHETPMMPTNLITIILADYPRHPQLYIDAVNFRYRPQLESYLKFAKEIFQNVTMQLKSRFEQCTKVKVDHVAIPGFYPDSEQNPGLVSYRELALIYDEELQTVAHKMNVARLIGRQVARQCFDNFGKPTWWIYSWFNEGITTLFAADAINKISPNVSNLIVVQIQQESLWLDSIPTMVHLGLDANDIYVRFPFTYHVKAPAVLRMLQHMLTNNVFWKGIEIFLETVFHTWKNDMWIDLNNLWIAMKKGVHQSFKPTQFDVKTVMDSWMRLNRYPIIKMERLNSSSVKIFVDMLNQPVQIPITIQRYIYSNNTSIYHETLLETFSEYGPYNGSMLLPYPNDWMIINVQQTGYYRVNYDVSNWYEIYRFLNISSNIKKIHVLNRAQIIDDAFYFLMNNQLPLPTFLNLTTYLRQETHYIAWYPMFKALEHMSGFFLFEESRHIQTHMRDILHELLKNIGYTEKYDDNDLIKCLRQEAAKWTCIFGDSACTSVAINKLKHHLISYEGILPGWKKWTYCNGMFQNNENWYHVFDIWNNTLNSNLLEYLSCSYSPAISISYLNTTVNSEKCNLYDPWCKKIPAKDRVINYLTTIAKYVKSDTILPDLLRDFDKIKPREVSTFVALIVMLNHVNTSEQLNKILENLENILDYFHDLIWFVEEKIFSRLSEIKEEKIYFENLSRNKDLFRKI